MATHLNISPPPLREDLTGGSWLTWFTKVYQLLKGTTPGMSADRGDASITLTIAQDAPTQIFGTALTVPRVVTLSSINTFVGAKFHITRQASATGASGLDVGGLKTLAVGTWCQVEYTGSAWILTAYGAL